MKLKIGKAITKGTKVLKENPIIFLLAGVIAFLGSFFNYFTVNFYQVGQAPTTLRELTGHLSGYQFLVGFLLYWLISSFISCIVSKMIYDSNYGKPSLAKATEVATKKFIPVLMVGIMWLLVVTIGGVFLILPGIFFGIKLLFSGYFVLIEDEGVFSSLSRSWNMTAGSWWRFFWLSLIIMGILPAILGLVVSPLPRLAESFADFLFAVIYLPLLNSLYLAAYLQLRPAQSGS